MVNDATMMTLKHWLVVALFLAAALVVGFVAWSVWEP